MMSSKGTKESKMLYIQPNFNYNTSQIVYFYVPDYIIYKEEGFCISSSQEINLVKKDNNKYSFEVHTKKDFVDFFKNERINIKVLCGKNGVGKTTLLELMAGRLKPKQRCIVLLQDSNGYFACNEKAVVDYDSKLIDINNTDYSIDFSLKEACVTHVNMNITDFNLHKNIVQHYKENPEIYDNVLKSKDLITHFTVELWNFKNNIELLQYGTLKSLLIDYDSFDFENWFSSDILAYFFTMQLQDIKYESVVDAIEQQLREGDEDYKTFFEDMLCSQSELQPLIDKYSELKEEIFDKEFELMHDFNRAQKILRKFSTTIYDFTKTAFELFNETLDYMDRDPYSLFYFSGYSKHENWPNRYIKNLSNGEWAFIKYVYEIFHSMIQHNGLWWYIDEPGQHFNPEFYREFLEKYMYAYMVVKKYLVSINNINDNKFNPDKPFTIIFSTHSPFLLSDLTNDYVIYLEKNDNVTSQVFAKDCFAGNIGEMFNTNFFLEKTIGIRAEKYLNSMLEDLNTNKINPKDDKFYEFKCIVKHIGDDLLKSLLLQRLENYEENYIQ